EMSALLYSGLVPYLIQKGARGVIGTEVDTPALFAAEFAKRFFQRFLTEQIGLGQLMLELRREFVEKHNNISGLFYSLYSNGAVCVVRE
ncbi:MAG: CHAT domain-containing protein, partial [Chloroflexales bacterium]|nr:CHAT domain-containing protein [Chloroflexales bacterium]